MNLKEMIGARIKEIRQKKSLTQEQLAERMDINSKYLSGIERGKENPTLNTLIKLAKSLDVDIGEIFTSVQIEDPTQRKTMINELLDGADNDQLKLAHKILSVVTR